NAKKEAFAAGKLHNDVPVSLSTALETEDDFKNLVIKQGDLRNKPVLLKQVADIVQRADNYEVRVRVNGKPGAVLAIKLASDANPLEVSRTVGKEVERIKAQLPDEMSVTIDVDSAGFIRASIENIQKSLMEAFLLVFGIILLFMRNFRACLVPLITIPISLFGVLGVFYACGLSINIITLLAIILAIGLVVDDGIVVLENIQRHIEEGRPVRQAAIEGSKEIGFAVIAMTLTLASVYAPIAFLQSTIGFLFREFSIALAGAVIISGIVSLTLCPMLCARLLKPKAQTFFPAFDVSLGALTTRYGALLKKVLDHKKYVLAFMAVAFVGAGFLVKHLPEEMAPPE
ncbi:MAG: efflux RND transporter permease subunit, partial [Alphaproteobacteria bacterium]